MRTHGTARVLTVSDRASAGVYVDRSGPILVDGLRELGFETADALIVADGQPVLEALRAAIADGVDLVLTTGGTGLGPRDLTPDMTAQVVTRHVPGLVEALRSDGLAHGVPAAVLSRGIAGIAGTSATPADPGSRETPAGARTPTLVVNVAGSPGAARDAIRVLGPALRHAVDQLRGGDHEHSPKH